MGGGGMKGKLYCAAFVTGSLCSLSLSLIPACIIV